MKTWKKLLLGLTGVFALTALAACSSSNNTLDKVKDKGTLTVTLNPHFAPFEFKTLQDGKDTVVGADVEIAKAIADELGVKVKFSEMSFDNVLASVQSGKADIAIAGISVTNERKKVYDFSDSYYTAENVVIVKKDKVNDFTSTDSLAKQTVGTQKGSVQETVAKKQIPKASVVSLASNGEMINELKSGQIQAVVLEKAIAEGYISQNDDLTLANFNLKSDGSDAYAVATRKGSDDLLKEINAVIKETKNSGKFDQWLKEASTYKQSK